MVVCPRAAQYITIYQWRDNKLKFIHGEYWGMVGGNDRSADIVRCTANKQRLEQYNIKECTGKTFNSGHHVYVTNSNGRTCYITVNAPKPPVIPPETSIVEIIPEPLQVYIQPTIPVDKNEPSPEMTQVTAGFAEPTQEDLMNINKIETGTNQIDIYNKLTDNLKTDNVNTPTITPTITSESIKNPLELTNKRSLLLIFGLLITAALALKINKKGD